MSPLMKQFLLLFVIAFTSIAVAQENPDLSQKLNVDFLQLDAEVSIFPRAESVSGNTLFKVQILNSIDSLFIDAKKMEFSEVLVNNIKAKYSNDGTRIWIKNKFKKGTNYEVSLSYKAKPTRAMYFINWDAPKELEVTKQVWTQGQGRDNSNWIPSLDDLTEKLLINLRVNFENGYEVVANGILQEKVSLNDSITQWKYKMDHPMSSYLMAIAAGDYSYRSLESATKVSLSLYFQSKDSLKFEPTYRHSQKIFDFLEKEIGVAYPWQNYKQIPVQDFIFSGMENTGTTIFSNTFIIDSTAFNDENYVFVNAHELAHQWFGNMVTEKNSQNHWLHEGFATYYAWLAEKEVFGEDYYYWKLFQSAEQLKELSDSGKGESLLNPKASSLTFYQKGAWALHMLKELVGKENFDTAIKNYLNNNAYSIVTTENFIEEVEKASKRSVDSWVQDWLHQSAFQGSEALESLQRSAFIKDYMGVAALRETPFSIKKELLSKALTKPINEYVGQEAIFQISGENSPAAIDLYKKAFASNNIMLRQAIAVSIDKIPLELKSDFFSLLKDESYITIENALLKAWLQFPEETAYLLEQTKDVQGFQNKNVRLLWLIINLVSPEVDPELSKAYFNELSQSTSKYLPSGLRQNALGYLYQLNAFTSDNLKDLLSCAQHPNYRFKNYCTSLLDQLLLKEEYRLQYAELHDTLNSTDKEFLTKKLEN
tara:strand:+ start:32569 stop:34698 length:2130 start_codon:yes stop_codon:yes gene_type:complete